MERLKQNAYILSAILIGTGAFALARTTQAGPPRVTEKVMEERAPASVPGYQLIPGPEGLAYSYKMDKVTYETLKPYGIVARNYTDGTRTFDAVLISSDSHESFHDPKICFSGQGYSFTHAKEQKLDLPDGRTIPMTVVEMNSTTGSTIAAYFYKGPNGFTSRPQSLQLDMFKEVLFGRKPTDSTFYRFMPSTPGVTLEQLKGFIKTYMVAAAQQSGGFF
jgi:hypothetical protein